MKTRLAAALRTRAFQTLSTFLVIAVVMWIARYARASQFGLYEDDWTFIPRVIDMRFSELIKFISNYIVQFQGQGRPLHHSLIRLFAFWGWKIGGLRGMYWIGYLIVTGNALLFYLLLRRLYNHAFGFVGALAYCLYSADTTQAFLTHSLGLHPALTLFFLAMHAYLSRRHILAYVLIFISLLIYETPYLLFLAAPLLAKEWDKRIVKRLLVHGMILGGFFFAIYLLRVSIGEYRVSTLSLSEAIATSVRHMVEGPIYNLGSSYENARFTYWALDTGNLIFMLFCFPIAFALLFLTIKRSSIAVTADHDEPHGPRTDPLSQFRQRLNDLVHAPEFKTFSKLLLTAVVMLVLAYPLTFTTEPDFFFGRETRDHFAGVVGNAMLMGALWVMLTELFRNRWIQLAAALGFAAIFSVMAGFGQVIQADYARGWKYQQDFWTQLLDLVPDVGENTAILVDPSGMQESIHILANTWNMPRVLERIFEFPEEWEFPPSVYKMEPGWLEILHRGNGTLRLDAPAALTSAEFIREVDPDEMILIVTVDGKLSRQYSPIEIDGASYPLKAPSEPTLQNFPHRTFYDVLIVDADG